MLPVPLAVASTFTGKSVAYEAWLIGACSLLFPLLILLCKGRISKWYAAADQHQISSTVTTLLIPTIFGIVTAWSNIFKGDTWDNPGENILLPLGTCCFLTGLLVVIKIVEAIAKGVLTGSLTALRKRRDAALVAVELFTEVVTEKLGRVLSLQRERGGKLTREVFVEGLNPDAQLTFLFKVAHTHYKVGLPRGKRLRLALYRRSDDLKALERVFSWDGERTSCYSGYCLKFMKFGPNPRAEMVKAFQGSIDLTIHQNCHRSSQQGDYEHLGDEHKKKLKSMIIYRHTLPEANVHGAFLLEMDTDADEFFKDDDADIHREFFTAFMQRVEYEYVTLDALR